MSISAVEISTPSELFSDERGLYFNLFSLFLPSTETEFDFARRVSNYIFHFCSSLTDFSVSEMENHIIHENIRNIAEMEGRCVCSRNRWWLPSNNVCSKSQREARVLKRLS